MRKLVLYCGVEIPLWYFLLSGGVSLLHLINIALLLVWLGRWLYVELKYKKNIIFDKKSLWLLLCFFVCLLLVVFWNNYQPSFGSRHFSGVDVFC